MMVRSWMKACVVVVTLALLAFWGWSECKILQQRVVPRLGKLRLWPDGQAVRSRAMLERVNIHAPDFIRLTRALSGKDSPAERRKILEEGIKYYGYITDLRSDRFDAYMAQGVCEYGLKNYPEAEGALKRALYLWPNFFWTYYDLGMLYFNSGVYQVARGFLEGALTRIGSYDEKVLLESKIFLDLLRADQDRLVGQGIVSPLRNLHMAIAVSCFFQRDFACVAKSSDTGRKLGGGAEFSILSGVAAFQMGDDVRALKFLTEAIAEDPSNGAPHFFLALSLKRTGNEAGFLMYYKKAMDLGFDPKKFLAAIKFPLRLY